MIEVTSTPQFQIRVDEENVPHEYLCPIAREIMRDPAITVDGYTFQKEVIEKWFKDNDKSPITGLQIEKKVIQNRALKQAIKYHKERQQIAHQNAQKLIQASNAYIKKTLPDLINDIGMLDLDKLITLSIQNIELKQTLSLIVGEVSKLEKRMQAKPKLCENCSKQKQAFRNINNILKKAQNVIKAGPSIPNLHVTAKQFQYLVLGVSQLKKIDFCQLKKENWKTKTFKSYQLQKCPIQILTNRIKKLNKLPESSYTQLWRTCLEPSEFYDRIKKQLSHEKCTYNRKIQEVGTKITNTKLQFDELGLRQGEYLIIQYGEDDRERIFRGDQIRCQYCYYFKPEKVHCSCEAVSYCSIKCGEKDREFHEKQCQVGFRATLISC